MKQQQKTISNLSRKPTQTTQQQKTTIKTLKKDTNIWKFETKYIPKQEKQILKF